MTVIVPPPHPGKERRKENAEKVLARRLLGVSVVPAVEAPPVLRNVPGNVSLQHFPEFVHVHDLAKLPIEAINGS